MTDTDFSPLSVEETVNRLLSAEDVLILMHVHPDGDTYGSAVALSNLFHMMGKSAAITCADPIPPRLAFIGTYAPPLRDAALPYKTVIAVDVASPQQLGAFADIYQADFMIDHHGFSRPFADYHTCPDASAAGEVIYRLAVALQKRGAVGKFPKPLVNALYAAISSDSGCFRYNNTTPATHRIAADLMEMGADAAAINHALFDSKSAAQIRAESLIADRLQTFANGKIVAAAITKSDRDTAGLADSDFETAIDIARSLAGSTVAIVAKESNDTPGQYKVSLRSTGPDVAAVAALFGGGGHIRAAGCSVTAESPDAALAAVVTAAVSKL